MGEMIVLVDENDREVGSEEKMKAHREGKLHRAFSIFIFNSKGRVLLAKRAEKKYHWGGFWSNACCSHPRKGEGIEEAAQRRLREELGFSCELKEAFSFTYDADFDNGLGEHEFDHVFVGTFDGTPEPNADEVESWAWAEPEVLDNEINDSAMFTPWCRIAWKKMREKGLV